MQNSTLEKFIKRISQPLYDNGAVNIVCLGDSVTQGAFGLRYVFKVEVT